MPHTDEFWIARIVYWPGGPEVVTIIKVYYAWKNGQLQFVPFGNDEGEPVWNNACHKFELLEKIDMEKYE